MPYRPEWPESARVLIEVLRAALHPMALRIEHIGSTAVPGMAAKDILDIQVSVADLKDVDEAFDPPLFALGFERSPYRFDHVPAGGAHEPTRWEKRLWSRRGHVDRAVNLHTRIEGSPNERLALLFRDWFRAHPEAVSAYASFKMALAALCADSATYADTKDPVVDLVMAAAAEPWALATGWRP